jgi:type VI secretion system protein ImpJ
MAARSVHWNEGMFLCPQHMQLAERLDLEQVYLADRWNLHHGWGLRALDLDVEALAESRFVVRSLQARLRDGTPVCAPEDGTLAPLDLKPALEQAGSVTVLLAVPHLHPGKRNAVDPYAEPAADGAGDSDDRAAGDIRFLVDEQQVEDENTGDNPQPVRVRLLNLKLLPSTDPQAGYEVLPLARVALSAGAEPVADLDPAYIPPLLACDAWKPLRAGVLEVIYDRLGKKIDVLANQVLARGISFDTRHRGAPQRLGQLHALNAGSALLGGLAFAEGIHPLPAYLELCRLVGQLAVFGPARRVPELPRYDHDDLAGCFYRVKQYLDDLLNEVEEPTWEERQFVGEGLRMQVALEEKWLQPSYQLFVGARSPLPGEQCVQMLTRAAQLDMKIGSAVRVDQIFDRGEAGLKFTHAAAPPQALPAEPGLVYFQVSRESRTDEWRNVEQSRTLALRLNQNRIAGAIQGQRVLQIRAAGQTTTMQFTLYVLPPEA